MIGSRMRANIKYTTGQWRGKIFFVPSRNIFSRFYMAADNTDVRYLDMTHCDLEWVGKLEGRRELGGEHRGQISVRWAVIGPEWANTRL